MADFRDTRVSRVPFGVLVGQALTAASGGALTLLVGGVQVTARVVAGLTVNAQDQVLVTRRNSTYYVTNVVAPAPVVAPPPPPPPPDTAPSKGDPAPPPRPVTRTGNLTCSAVSTATFRDGSWRSDTGPVDSADTYQGRYSGSSFGRMTGCAFYGSKPRTLHGATVTRATVHVRRMSGSGINAASTATLRLLSQSTRPSGAPTLNESTTGPSLAVGATNNSFAIPTSWAQAMVDGTRGGLAISISSDTPYICLAGRRSWSAAWALVISWRRTS